MADIWIDVDVALTELPVNKHPLTDDTDFKTIEGAVAYNAAGMSLAWHFVTTAGVYNNGLAVTPTTSGDYDWTDHGAHGVYTIEMPASGGASANNDTEGFGWWTGVATGVLPWSSPIYGFRAAAMNNSMIDAASGGVLAPTVAGRALAVSATGGVGATHSGTAAAIANGTIDLASGHGITATTIVVRLTGGTNAVGKARVATHVSGDQFSVDPDWNVAVNGLTETLPSGTITYEAYPLPPSGTSYNVGQTGDAYARLGAPAGASVSADIAVIEGQTDDIGAAGAGLTALASAATIATVAGYLDTEIAAILALLDDARGEPGQGAPPVNPDLATKIDYLYKAWRNRSTQTATEYALYADDGTTKDHEAACSDDATTFVRGEVTTGA